MRVFVELAGVVGLAVELACLGIVIWVGVKYRLRSALWVAAYQVIVEGIAAYAGSPWLAGLIVGRTHHLISQVPMSPWHIVIGQFLSLDRMVAYCCLLILVSADVVVLAHRPPDGVMPRTVHHLARCRKWHWVFGAAAVVCGSLGHMVGSMYFLL